MGVVGVVGVPTRGVVVAGVPPGVVPIVTPAAGDTWGLLQQITAADH
jgi:hypothetical protein